MNERYTYGYGNGWNVENEYMSEQQDIISSFNNQKKKINDIKTQIARIENLLNEPINEDEIRETYNRYYSDGLRSYQSYRENVLKVIESQKIVYNEEMTKYKNQYYANVKYLIDIKNETRKKINQRRRELEILLEEKRIQLSIINSDYGKNSISDEQRRQLMKKYDETFLEIKKLQDALSSLNQMYTAIDFTQEEYGLMMSGLNPQQRVFYEEILEEENKVRTQNLEPKPDNDNNYEPDTNTDNDNDNEFEPDTNTDNDNDNEFEPDANTDNDNDNEDDYEVEDVYGIEDNYENNNGDDSNLFNFLLNKVCGGVKYTKFDNFIYTHKDIKVFNWQKTTAVTFLDKIAKVSTATFAAIINTGTKLFSKAAYKKVEESRERINTILENINKLTEKELDELFKELNASNNLKQCRGVIPDIAWTVIYQKLSSRIDLKVRMVNSRIEALYKKIIINYKKAKDLQKMLTSSQLSNEERRQIEEYYNSLSNELCIDLREMMNIKRETDAMANASGLYGISENYRARKNKTMGGRNVSDKFHSEAGIVAGKMDEYIMDARAEGDGVKAVEYYLLKQKYFSENTIVKRTLKNRFGEANVGPFDFTPFVEYTDYSRDTYWRDVFVSINLVTSLLNSIYLNSLENQLEQANDIIQQQGELLTKIKGFIDNLNPSQAADELSKYYQEAFSNMQSSVEYLTATAQAGSLTSTLTSGGELYEKYDELFHNLSGDAIRQLKNISNDSSLSGLERIDAIRDVALQYSVEFYKVLKEVKSGVESHLNSFGDAYDFTAVETLIGTIGVNNPTFVADLYQNLITVAEQVKNLSAMNQLININTNIPILPQLIPVATMLGYSISENVKDSKNEKEDKNKKSYDEHLKEKTGELKDLLSDLDIDVDRIAKEKYDERKEEWDKKGFFYKLTHRKEKFTESNKVQRQAEAYIDVLNSEERGRLL